MCGVRLVSWCAVRGCSVWRSVVRGLLCVRDVLCACCVRVGVCGCWCVLMRVVVCVVVWCGVCCGVAR